MGERSGGAGKKGSRTDCTVALNSLQLLENKHRGEKRGEWLLKHKSATNSPDTNDTGALLQLCWCAIVKHVHIQTNLLDTWEKLSSHCYWCSLNKLWCSKWFQHWYTSDSLNGIWRFSLWSVTIVKCHWSRERQSNLSLWWNKVWRWKWGEEDTNWSLWELH